MSLLSNLERKVKRTRRRASRSGVDLPPAPEEHTESYILDVVNSMDSRPEKVRVGSDYIHLSSLIGCCPRKHIIARRSGMESSGTVRSGMRIVWALGRAAENHVRKQFIAGTRAIGVIGRWTCRCGHEVTEPFHDPALLCSRCETPLDNYGEVVLVDEAAKIIGSPDLPYVRPDTGKVRVVEIKSINYSAFSALKKPIIDHVHQAVGYHELLRLSDVDVDTGVTIFYVSKDFNWNTPYKEFHVEREEEHDRVIERMWHSADLIRAGTDGTASGLPERLGVCGKRDYSVPKDCEMCGPCFSQD